jgi:hypothetical protein
MKRTIVADIDIRILATGRNKSEGRRKMTSIDRRQVDN